MPCRPCLPASYNDSKVTCDDRSSTKLVAYLKSGQNISKT